MAELPSENLSNQWTFNLLRNRQSPWLEGTGRFVVFVGHVYCPKFGYPIQCVRLARILHRRAMHAANCVPLF